MKEWLLLGGQGWPETILNLPYREIADDFLNRDAGSAANPAGRQSQMGTANPVRSNEH